MLRKLRLMTIVLSMVLPAAAAGKSATISGYVRSSGGVPQMGAVVEILGSATQRLKVFTDDHGFYSAANLAPGVYNLRVSAPSFLPAMRDKIGIQSGASVIVNLTLNTLFEAMQVAPLRGAASDDDWKWTLRSASNRPILRALDPSQVSSTRSVEGDEHDLRASLSFLAGSGSQGFGSASDMSTSFSVEHSLFSSGTLDVMGNVGYGSGSPAAVLRTTYAHKMANGSEPRVALTMRRLAGPDVNYRSTALQALSLNTSDDITLGDVLELHFGSELQTVQFLGRVNAFRPYGSADLHLAPGTVLEYQYASELPDRRTEKGFDSAPADLSESGPHMSIAGYAPALQKMHHQEVSLSQRIGRTSLQVAFFTDHVSNPALTGVGTTGMEAGEVLPDLYSGTFTYQGRSLDTSGLRVVMSRKLSPELTATVDYGFGGALELPGANTLLADAREEMRVQRHHALSGKLSGTLPRANTRWITSYGWTSDEVLTPVDMFNASPGQSDPYLNVFLRQPIPGTGALPVKMEALLDIRNLLAQGYVPMIGEDRRTVYLVQSARSVRGGVAFVF